MRIACRCRIRCRRGDRKGETQYGQGSETGCCFQLFITQDLAVNCPVCCWATTQPSIGSAKKKPELSVCRVGGRRCSRQKPGSNSASKCSLRSRPSQGQAHLISRGKNRRSRFTRIALALARHKQPGLPQAASLQDYLDDYYRPAPLLWPFCKTRVVP